MAKAVKLSDIAVRVGVSTVTVSKALSDQKGVSEELRERIKVLADEMGYKQPSAAKKQQTHKSYNIGVLIPEHYLDKYDSFYWQMYQEVTTKAVSKNCFTLLEVVSSAEEEEGRLPKLLLEKKADGIVVVGSMSKGYLAELNQYGKTPVLYLDFYDEEQGCDAVISNGFYGAYVLTNYLYHMGHRKIAYVGTLLSTKSITDRYFGYSKSLLEHGIAQREDYIIPDRDLGSGMIDEDNLLKLPEDMPSAFVCNSDLTASFLIRKLERNGYRVPDDISVVGFDNFLYPGLCNVGITTYEVDMKEMARRVIHNITRKIENPHYKPGVFIVDGSLVCRESVRRV